MISWEIRLLKFVNTIIFFTLDVFNGSFLADNNGKIER